VTGSVLISEAERISRPCVLLCEEGPQDRLAALWGGPGVVPAPDTLSRHWITVDCRFLPVGLGLSAGCLSIYTCGQDEEIGLAVHDPAAKLGVGRGAVKLFAHQRRSLPPIDAVFRFGSPVVQGWLRSHGWEPDWGYNSNFKDPRPAEHYERAYQAECPLYSGGAHAVLGGWHFPWPDGDWEELLGRPLLVWTFADSEPWLEVWGGDGDFQVMQRIT
jgi:hypothetical protein